MSLFFSDEFLGNALTAIAGPNGSALWVHLLQALPDFDAGLIFAELVESTFPGYVPYHAASWSDPFKDSNGDMVIQSPALEWSCSGGGSGEYVFAYALTLGPWSEGIGLAAQALVAPVQVASSLSRVNVKPIKLAARNLLS